MSDLKPVYLKQTIEVETNASSIRVKPGEWMQVFIGGDNHPLEISVESDGTIKLYCDKLLPSILPFSEHPAHQWEKIESAANANQP